jgi:hypothetical protein
VLSGANVFSNVVVENGIVTNVATRALTAGNISAAPANVTLTATNTINTDTTTPEVTGAVTSVMQTIWEKIRMVVNAFAAHRDNLGLHFGANEKTATWARLGSAEGRLDGKANTGTSAAVNANNFLKTVTLNANGVPTVTSARPTIANVNGLQAELDGKASASHTHAAGDISSETLAIARGGTGRTSIVNARANLASTTAANAVAGDIGVTGTFAIAIGGTGATTARNAARALMCVSAGGSVDLNTLDNIGSWTFTTTSGNTAINVPMTSPGSFILYVQSSGAGTDQCVQTFYRRNTANEIWIRSKTSTTNWTTWVRLGAFAHTHGSEDGGAISLINTTGTLAVSRGGTGATTFTSGAALIGAGTGAVTTRSITNATVAAGNTSTNLITANALSLSAVFPRTTRFIPAAANISGATIGNYRFLTPTPSSVAVGTFISFSCNRGGTIPLIYINRINEAGRVWNISSPNITFTRQGNYVSFPCGTETMYIALLAENRLVLGCISSGSVSVHHMYTNFPNTVALYTAGTNGTMIAGIGPSGEVAYCQNT